MMDLTQYAGLVLDVLFIIGGLAVIITSLGILHFREQKNIVYARLHIAGVYDVVCITVMLAVGQPLIALTYFLLTPLATHVIANARYYRGEGK